MRNKKIVIGYDGSSSAQAALAWGLDEASRTGAAAELVYADEWPTWAPAASLVPSPALRPDTYVDEVIGGMLERAAASARQTHPRVPVNARTVQSLASTALTGRSDHAEMIVLGTRGHSALAGLLGSVGASVGARAHCPVVVVHGEVTGDGPVVAGVDSSSVAPAVLRFAAEQAAGHAVPLRIVAIGADETAVTDAVAAISEQFPGLPVHVESTAPDDSSILIKAGDTASLLVMGSRGHGAVRGMLLGSVSRRLLRHAACPIAIVHDLSETGAQS